MKKPKAVAKDPRKMSREELTQRLHLLQADVLSSSENGAKLELRVLLHELEVYQIELEMQNRELRESQAAIEESRDRYVDLYDFAPVGYVSLNIHGIIREINLTATVILGSERKNLLDRAFTPWLLPTDVKKFRDHLRRCSQGEARVLSELHLLRRDKTIIPIELLSIPSNGSEGEVMLKTTITDLTERKNAEEERAALIKREQATRIEAERANQAKDNFLAIVSHELRTPLQPILSWVHLLQRDELTDMQKKGLRVIENSAKAQAQIINDLLDISRVISGTFSLEQKLFDIRSVVEGAIESCQFQSEFAGLKLEAHLPNIPVLIRGDSSRIQQVVWNLLSNAIKFTPKGGQVSVDLKSVGPTVQIQVKDTGRGIPTELLPHIFERFRQEDSSSTRSSGGLGLGLAIARYFVERHDGTIVADSEGENRGAMFTVTLPLAEGVSQVESLEGENSLKSKSNTGSFPPVLGVRILLVEDDDKTRESLKEALETLCEGEVISAYSAENALEMLKKHQPDILISDLAMPGKDGYTLIREIRQLDPNEGGQIPAAALSAYVGKKDVERALDAGFQVHIPKPVELSTLRLALKDLAEKALQAKEAS